MNGIIELNVILTQDYHVAPKYYYFLLVQRIRILRFTYHALCGASYLILLRGMSLLGTPKAWQLNLTTRQTLPQYFSHFSNKCKQFALLQKIKCIYLSCLVYYALAVSFCYFRTFIYPFVF